MIKMVTKKFTPSATQAQARQVKATERTQEQLNAAAPDERLPDHKTIEVIYVMQLFRPLAYEVHGYNPGEFAAFTPAPQDAKQDAKATIAISNAEPIEREKGARILSTQEIAQREKTRREPRPHSGRKHCFAGGSR
jgi:hypothetical protein